MTNEKLVIYWDDLEREVEKHFTEIHHKIFDCIMRTKDSYYRCYDAGDRWYIGDTDEEGGCGGGCCIDYINKYRCGMCNHEDYLIRTNGILNIVEHGLMHYEEYKDLKDINMINELGDETEYIVYPNDNEKYSSYYGDYLMEALEESFTQEQHKLLNKIFKTKVSDYDDYYDDKMNWFEAWDVMEDDVNFGDSCSDGHYTHYKCGICNHKDVISNKGGIFNITKHGLMHYEEYKNLKAFI